MGWFHEIDDLLEYYNYQVGRKVAECKYCRSDFHPTFYRPDRDHQWGRWQQFCSGICRRLWFEEKAERLGKRYALR